MAAEGRSTNERAGRRAIQTPRRTAATRRAGIHSAGAGLANAWEGVQRSHCHGPPRVPGITALASVVWRDVSRLWGESLWKTDVRVKTRMAHNAVAMVGTSQNFHCTRRATSHTIAQANGTMNSDFSVRVNASAKPAVARSEFRSGCCLIVAAQNNTMAKPSCQPRALSAADHQPEATMRNGEKASAVNARTWTSGLCENNLLMASA